MSIARAGMLSAAALAAWFMCALPVAHAGENGSFELMEIYLHDYTTLEFPGQTVTGGPLRGIATVLESSGAPFAEGTNYSAECLVYVKRSEAGIELESSCTLTDLSGDKLHLLAQRRQGDVEAGGGGQGSQRIVGGTGEYAGIAGDCPYTTTYLPDNWLVSRAACAW